MIVAAEFAEDGNIYRYSVSDFLVHSECSVVVVSVVELSLMNALQGPHHRGVRLGEGGFPRPNSLRGLRQLGLGDLGQGVQAAGRLPEAPAARHAVLAQPGRMMGSE